MADQPSGESSLDIGKGLVFHLPRSWLGPFGSGLLPFYQKLTDGLAARDMSFVCKALDRETLLDEVAADEAFHIVNHGRFRHPRVLNAGIAYVYPFWNLDPFGIRAFSSIAETPFDPRGIDAEVARPFFRRLKARIVGGRASRYEQPADVVNVPAGCVAVFLQSEAHRGVGETMWLDRRAMVDAALEADIGPVVVKPHPRDTDPGTRDWLAGLPVTVSEGNIHDLIAASSRVVTINSAVGVEAYLHRKPVVLCGRADFHHIADEARSGANLVDVLRAEPRRRAYDKYVWWYFADRCLSTTEPGLVDRFLERVAQGGATAPG
ncbi:MAG: hypothetical protein AAGM84_07560 [Pseudomonadota bacterium]